MTDLERNLHAIQEKTYIVYIDKIYTYTDKEKRDIGIILDKINGKVQYPKMAEKQLVGLTILDMAKKNTEGAEIQLKNENELIPLYDKLERFLYYVTTMNGSIKQMFLESKEMILLLEEFADKIFESNKKKMAIESIRNREEYMYDVRSYFVDTKEEDIQRVRDSDDLKRTKIVVEDIQLDMRNLL